MFRYARAPVEGGSANEAAEQLDPGTEPRAAQLARIGSCLRTHQIDQVAESDADVDDVEAPLRTADVRETGAPVALNLSSMGWRLPGLSSHAVRS